MKSKEKKSQSELCFLGWQGLQTGQWFNLLFGSSIRSPLRCHILDPCPILCRLDGAREIPKKTKMKYRFLKLIFLRGGFLIRMLLF